MPIQKQNFNITFGHGVNTKVDPNQIPIGQFASMVNSVFGTTNRLSKRNGFGSITSLPDLTSSYLTTFHGNLTAIGTTLRAFNQGNESWVDRGRLQPVTLSVIPVIRNTFNQTQCDSVTAPNGSVCTVYTETDIGATNYYYVISDGVTSQTLVSATLIATPSESPRVFLLGNFFILLYSQSTAIKYIAIPIYQPSSPHAAISLVTNYGIGMSQLAFDGAVFNNTLYISYNGSDGGGAIRGTALNSFLVAQTSVTGVVLASGKAADMMSVSVDETASEVWTLFYLTSGTSGYVIATDPSFNSVLAATQVIAAGTILNVTSAAQNGVVTILYEVSNNYSFDATIPTHFIRINTVTAAGVVGTASVLERSVGLASKAFILESTIYFLNVYSSPYQPTYFLSDTSGHILAKLAYQNGGGYLTKGLPGVSIDETALSIPYLFKDLIAAVNKNTNVATGTQINGIYSQTGINLATFDITTDHLSTAEIGSNLNLTGGFLWAYDGTQATENNFFLYPDLTLNSDGTYHGLSTSNSGGFLTAQPYFYQVTYEWTDQQGNAFRSAPSVPVTITTTGSTSTNTLLIPTLRLTYKTNVKVVVYRWSISQQAYYQVTSISVPTISSKTSDTVTVTDTFSDATILGNNLIYTSGGVVEDIGPPAFNAVTLFNTRLMGIEAEDPNTIWYSKQVISNTPVEMSDLFTIYTPPTTGAQASTGPNACLFPMDDKLILFKRNAGIYYLTGIGPDNTGANSDFSNAIFITSTVGCGNQSSIVFIPQGLLFQDGTGKGIWLLGRDLSSIYIGAPVEAYNSERVTSAFAIPGTNEVRFTLENGVILVYDYFQQQWDTFQHLNALSSCLYQELQTYIDPYGEAFQETPSKYLDGSNPVVMSFTTGWINLASLQGYQRAYYFYLLGNYLSPHRLTISIAYDYNPSPQQTVIIDPLNYSAPWGSDPYYGSSSPWGGASTIEQWRIFFSQQQCQAFQLTISESYDASFGVAPGAGFTLSGLDLVVGLKKGYPRLAAGAQVQAG